MANENLEREMEELRARLDAIPTSPSCEISFDQAYNENKIKEFKKKIDESSFKYLNAIVLKIVSAYILLKQKFLFDGGGLNVGGDYFMELDKFDPNGNFLYWKIGIIEKLEEVKKKFKFFTYKVPFEKKLYLIKIGCFAIYNGKVLTVRVFTGKNSIEPLNMSVADFIIQHGEVLNFFLEEEITRLTGELAGNNFKELGELEAQAYLLEGMSREGVSMEIAKVKIPEKARGKAEVIADALFNFR